MTKNVYDMIYPVPVDGPLDERYYHEDIQRMSELEIQKEMEQARLRLLMERKPPHWLLARLDRLREGLEHAN